MSRLTFRFGGAMLLAGLALGLTAPAAQAQFDIGKINKGLKQLKNAGKVAKGATGIGLQEEQEIGASVALEIIDRHGGLVRDESVSRRVNLVGKALAHYSSRPALNWRFGVLDSDTVNGFSAPGGYVFITRALYELAGDSDDVLAAVLAHEIAHITGRHAINIIRRGEFVSGMSGVLAERSSDLREAQQVARQFDLSVDEVVNTILEKGFDPQTEYAADAQGRDLAVTTGYAPGALRSLLIRLQQDGRHATGLFSTHPPLPNRVERLPAD